MLNIPFAQEGKLFKDLDLQITIKKLEIKEINNIIKKAYKLAGTDGPKGIGGMDYSRVTSSTPVAHIGLEDAIRMTKKENSKIKKLENEIATIRTKKKKAMKIFEELDELDKQIFYYRVIMDLTQKEVAEKTGYCERHVQRVDQKIRPILILLK